jgi:DNA-3-methyladenine glycosylase II
MIDVLVFDETNPAVKTLALADEKLACLIDRIGGYTLELETDYFASLAQTIVGQQLSLGAARTIWDRISKVCGCISPRTILSANFETLREVGVSKAKIGYLKDLAEQTANGTLNFDRIITLPNEEIIKVLTNIKGIGRWTAEMFLIFSLGRLDVLSTSDVGLQRAIRWLYSLDSEPTKIEIAKYDERWNPYQTVASLYLWEAVNRKLIK